MCGMCPLAVPLGACVQYEVFSQETEPEKAFIF
jgi:hypothetical protein